MYLPNGRINELRSLQSSLDQSKDIPFLEFYLAHCSNLITFDGRKGGTVHLCRAMIEQLNSLTEGTGHDLAAGAREGKKKGALKSEILSMPVDAVFHSAGFSPGNQFD